MRSLKSKVRSPKSKVKSQGSRVKKSSQKPVRVAILTVSDKGFTGEREDKSGQVIREMVTRAGAEVIAYEIVPDERKMIEEKLIFWADQDQGDVILTTGGTGFSPRDVTPEATLAVTDRLAPGFAEAMRHESLKATPHAMLSRAISGIRKKTLIINLPGSPKAVTECLQVVLQALPHGVEVLRGEVSECADNHQIPSTK